MGCLVSKQLTSGEKAHRQGNNEPNDPPSGRVGMSRRPSVQYNRAIDRVDAIEASKTVTIGDTITLTYAYVSQRGRYPDEPFKPNQDAYCIHAPLHEKRNDALFAVFDGHGKDGDGCAKFAKGVLPTELQQRVDAYPPSKILAKDEMLSALTEAHVATNQQLHTDATVDDSLSGTTAVSIYFHGHHNRITVSNVGDSRAVLGQRNPQSQESAGANKTGPPLKALPLSRDQTPYRNDEKARIKKTGARVLSLDQLEGLEPIPDEQANAKGGKELVLGDQLDEGGDPPRVWHATQDYPGTAFTRSIGDALAEELGVYAEPELLSRQIQPNDKMLVIASDGVFEFLTNQSVIDMCAKFTDPLEACRAVVAEAYELWLQYELRTDDITIICMFIDNVEKPARPPPKMQLQHQLSNDNLVEVEDSELKPVRTNMSKEKQKELEKLHAKYKDSSQGDNTPIDLSILSTPKTPEEKAAIADAIKASVMFRNISDAQRELVYACMESIPVKAGTWVIRQGQVGDRFYIVDDGSFEVRIIPDDAVQEDSMLASGGHIVHQYHGSREKHHHPSFGDLALMHSAPRSASVVAQTNGHLWALHRAAFRQILLVQDIRKDFKDVLVKKNVFPQLKDSPDSDKTLDAMVALSQEVKFAAGVQITGQGQPADALYVLRSGSAYGTAVTSTGTERQQIGKHGVVGMIPDGSNSSSAVFTATVVTMQPVTCWKLEAAALQKAGIHVTTMAAKQGDTVEC